MIPTLPERVKAALDEIDVCRRATAPEDYPAWPASLVAANHDAHRDRANALTQQINDVIAVLAERGWL